MTEQIVKRKSNNPKGRPKRGNTVAELLREYLDAQATDEAGGPMVDKDGLAITRKRALINRLYTIAMIGSPKDSVPAIKLIVEYTDGKPTQTIVQHNIDVTALSDKELDEIVKEK